ncbi:MAG TPA: DUF1707 domain-containing protein [Gemmatimonadaceae bacterium]|nr:DUF1707 domain-containing protein [Gemmatimonadaceae bacterium]
MTSPDAPLQSLERERERVVTLLSRQFASDHLSLEELEARLELAYRATSIAEVRALAADLPMLEGSTSVVAPRPAAPPAQRASQRILALMGNMVRRGVWVPPQYTDLVAVMAEARIDLRQAQLSAGVTELHVQAWWASVNIIVPPGVHVELETTAFMATVNDRTSTGRMPPHGAPVVRISGWAVMSEVTVRTRELDE